jgi:pyridoxine 4-dehydrogenase
VIVPDHEPAAAAGTVTLGDDLTVNRMGFGAMWITRAGPERGAELLRRALELGVNLIDTADIYGGGGSEQLIAEALHPYPDGLVIATKGGQVPFEQASRPDCRPEHLREACEASLGRLRLECIDLYQLHNPDPEVPLEEALGALGELRGEGKIRHIGVSNLYADQLSLAISTVPVASVQNLYSPTVRSSERELETCQQHDIAFMPYRPLDSGEIAGNDGAILQIASAHGATPAQVALAWLLEHSAWMLPIPGTASIEHLEENVRAAALRLNPDELDRLDSLAAKP